ncbi:MAG: ADP-ribose pyrophosphatase YjhB (NUDIX family) [Pseudohongiellaceae bacterium]|jgi:ADP-ribose pyrophosphatase YjhB (NUDIX family)
MTNERWKPNVTVATLVVKDNKFLMVNEIPDGIEVCNQPAGHLDENESLINAARRETIEETGWEVEITNYLGLYRHATSNGITYLRHSFLAKPIRHYPEMELDTGIIEAVWMSYDDICKQKNLRGPLVKRLLDDYIAGKIYGLEMFYD